MRSVLVIQQVAHEGLGTIAAALRSIGFSARCIRVYAGERVPKEVAPPDEALIVLGGPMGVYEEDKNPFIRDELRLIESAVKAGVPVLGICLGAQLMAKAAGARVYKGKSKEIGWYDVSLTPDGMRDRLFSGLPQTMKTFQWHGDTFDVPRGGTLLASSEEFPSQLVRMGRNAYAFQFHLEVTEAMICEWLSVDENREEIEKLEGAIDPEKIIEETPANIPALHAVGDAVFRRFFRSAKPEKMYRGAPRYD